MVELLPSICETLSLASRAMRWFSAKNSNDVCCLAVGDRDKLKPGSAVYADDLKACEEQRAVKRGG